MECSCTIDPDVGEGALDISGRYLTATGEEKCCECGCQLRPGEQYLYEEGVPVGEDEFPEEEQNWHHFATCLDCECVREQFFFSFMYTHIWDDLQNYLEDSGASIHEECIAALTPRAREMVCALIEDVWEDLEEEENQA